MESLVDGFKRKMYLDGKSERTIEVYANSVKEFFKWFHDSYGDITFKKLYRANILEYKSYLKNVRKSERSGLLWKSHCDSTLSPFWYSRTADSILLLIMTILAFSPFPSTIFNWPDSRQMSCFLILRHSVILSPAYASIVTMAKFLFAAHPSDCSTPKGYAITPHTLRHFYAINAISSGTFTIPEIAGQMGHSSIKTTMRYMNPNLDEIRKKVEML